MPTKIKENSLNTTSAWTEFLSSAGQHNEVVVHWEYTPVTLPAVPESWCKIS